MLSLVSQALTGLVAVEHVYILVLEMFLWTKPAGRRAFGMSAEDAERTKVLAANQGLYNGFLAAGLGWSFCAGACAPLFRTFFLVCVVVAGVYGGLTAARKILFVQALPAALALVATLLARG